LLLKCCTFTLSLWIILVKFWIWCKIRSVFLYRIQLIYHCLLKSLSFPHWIFLSSLSKTNWPYVCSLYNKYYVVILLLCNFWYLAGLFHSLYFFFYRLLLDFLLFILALFFVLRYNLCNIKFILKCTLQWDVVIHVCNPSTWENEAEGSWVWGQLRLHN
jgi:hypothetical protein